MSERIQLTPGYHAEAIEGQRGFFDVYTTLGPHGDVDRIHVGRLEKCAVETWRNTAGFGPDASMTPCDCLVGDCKRITRRCLESRP